MMKHNEWMNGTLQNVSLVARNPTVVVRKYHVTVLLVDWYHLRYRRETVLQEIRGRFYVAKLRT